VTANPVVTVGVPVFNCVDTIEGSLKSVLHQTYPSLEVLVSDNCSSDGTYEKLLRIASTDDRVRLFRHERNVGAPANFEWLANNANGQYFMWAAGDDLHDAGWVEALLRANRDHGRAAFGSVVVVAWRGNPVPHPSGNKNLAFPGPRFYRRARFFLQPSLEGKPNLVYSLMTTQQARRVAPFFALGDHGDIVGVFDLLKSTPIVTVPTVRLYKRLARPPVSEAPMQRASLRTFAALTWRTVFARDLLANAEFLERILLVGLLPFALARSAFTLAKSSNYKKLARGFVDLTETTST
jgi:glycosyltransferase involved in cell wall biosynthesis